MSSPSRTIPRTARAAWARARCISSAAVSSTGCARRGARVELCELAPTSESWVAEIGTAFDLDRQLAREVAAARLRSAFPLTLAGNCITSVGTVGGLGAGATGVLWFDAHGDFNTPETTIGGFLDGMALATVVGRCWRSLAAGVPGFTPVAEENVVLVGARDLDPAEA